MKRVKTQFVASCDAKLRKLAIVENGILSPGAVFPANDLRRAATTRAVDLSFLAFPLRLPGMVSGSFVVACFPRILAESIVRSNCGLDAGVPGNPGSGPAGEYRVPA